MKTVLLLVLVFKVSITFSQTQYLVPYRDGDLWGYADTNLNIVVTPVYDIANRFWNGYATVVKGNLYGLLNSKGKVEIKVEHDFLAETGDYMVLSKGMDTGLLHFPTRKFVLPMLHGKIAQISTDIFAVNRLHRGTGLFDAATGKWLLDSKYDDISWFHLSDSQSHYIARKKSSVIHFSISRTGMFSISKNAPYRAWADEQPKTSSEAEVIEEIIEPILGSDALSGDYYETYTFTENGKWGYKTIKNSIETTDSIPPVYDAINFVRNRSDLLVLRKNGKEGVITVEGDEVIPFIHDEVKAVDSTAVHDIFVIKNKGKYGLAKGIALLVPCVYDTIVETSYSFSGFNLVLNKKWGAYIYDRKRSLYNINIGANYDYIMDITFLIEPNFDRSVPYKETGENVTYLLYVSKNNKRGYIDLKGNEFFKN